MATIVHFEVPAEDVGRCKEFYAKLFGWEYEQFPGMEYTQVKTRALDGEEGLGGGMMKRAHPDHRITCFAHVDDIDAHAEKVTSLGGKIVLEKHAVPHMGWFCYFEDTEGNVMAMWEEDESAG